jgi:hypothetical protein
MKTKSLLLTAIFSLLLVSGAWAQNGERVYIREMIINSKTFIYIYEKGEVKEVQFVGPWQKSNEALKSFSEILDKYFQQGYKLIATSVTTYGNSYTQYIFEKQ